jgi:hypothetical protein
MDKHTLDNWKKIKEVLEKAGKTDCMFYKRALLILAGKPDPLR